MYLITYNKATEIAKKMIAEMKDPYFGYGEYEDFGFRDFIVTDGKYTVVADAKKLTVTLVEKGLIGDVVLTADCSVGTVDDIRMFFFEIPQVVNMVEA